MFWSRAKYVPTVPMGCGSVLAQLSKKICRASSFRIGQHRILGQTHSDCIQYRVQVFHLYKMICTESDYSHSQRGWMSVKKIRVWFSLLVKPRKPGWLPSRWKYGKRNSPLGFVVRRTKEHWSTIFLQYERKLDTGDHHGNGNCRSEMRRTETKIKVIENI